MNNNKFANYFMLGCLAFILLIGFYTQYTMRESGNEINITLSDTAEEGGGNETAVVMPTCNISEEVYKSCEAEVSLLKEQVNAQMEYKKTVGLLINILRKEHKDLQKEYDNFECPVTGIAILDKYAEEVADAHEYVLGVYDCEDFSQELRNVLHRAGWDVSLKRVRYNRESHQITQVKVYYEATTGQVIYPEDYEDYGL